MAYRYAIYTAPEAGSALHRFAACWLGYDPVTGTDLPQTSVPGLDGKALRAATKAPRTYGFHGTMKAPFRLAEGLDVADFEVAVQALAASWTEPLPVPLRLASLGRFLALVPAEPSAALDDLAGRCVTELDAWRATLTADERERRLQSSLSASETVNLERWGYPYVLQHFRYHMTLTGSLDDGTRTRLGDHLADVLPATMLGGFQISDLCVFEQATPGARFRIRSRYPLGTST